MTEQIAIALLGVTAIFLSQDHRQDWRKWACVFGLVGQPFWFIATIKAEQWGIVVLCCFYTMAWARGVKTNWIDARKPCEIGGRLRHEAADALEAADKRIAELEAAIIGWKADQKENMATAVEECKRANEAERKLAVARGALKSAYNTATDHDDREPFDWAVYCEMIYQTLAQIGGDDAS